MENKGISNLSGHCSIFGLIIRSALSHLRWHCDGTPHSKAVPMLQAGLWPACMSRSVSCCGAERSPWSPKEQ
eukprot:771880-Amphidinium_carterae.1